MNLSHSSISQFLNCPKRWEMEYLKKKRPPPTVWMVRGSVVHDAIAHILRGDNSDPVEEAWSNLPDEIEWDDQNPTHIKDQCVRVVRMYEEDILPRLDPAHVEQWFEIGVPLPPFDRLVVRPDLILTNGTVIDYKVRAAKVTQADADCDTQPTITAAVLGHPIHFEFHTLNPGKLTMVVTRTTRNQRHINHTMGTLLPSIVKVIRSCRRTGFFIPNPNAYHGGCKVKGCPYAT